MRNRIYSVLNKLYGVSMAVAFFAGIVPLIPFIIAIVIGGPAGEAIAVFLYNRFYPWIILLASIAIIVGLIAMYVGGEQSLSMKKNSTNKK